MIVETIKLPETISRTATLPAMAICRKVSSMAGSRKCVCFILININAANILVVGGRRSLKNPKAPSNQVAIKLYTTILKDIPHRLTELDF